MTANQFRRIALGMDGAIEGAHMGHPDFRAFGRIFATLHPGDKTGMVALTPEQQAVFVRQHPDAFLPESGAWGRNGSTRVVLAPVDEETLGEAMTLAWQNAADKQRRRGHDVQPRRHEGTKKNASRSKRR
jgi:YjbR protein